jgi:FKBP-type peptidyl-prolyl cis-trans isomerase
MNTGRGGVEIEEIRIGEGLTAHRGCTICLQYDLFLNRGEKIQENQVCHFRLGARTVIAGLEYGVEGMRVGGQRRIRAGPHLCYRDQGLGQIVPPKAVLEFHLTLLRVDLPAPAGG